MTTVVFLAVLGAALLHASWNALVKGGLDKRVTLCAVILGHVPPAFVVIWFVPFPAVESLGFLAVGVAFHAGYQVFLLKSYEIGDLTQVYPIARGAAPLIVTLVSVTALGVALSGAELLAILIIGCGIFSLTLVRRHDGLRNPRAAAMALITGLFIAGYSLVDGFGARAAGTALGYFSWLALINAGVLALFLAGTAPQVFRDIVVKARGVFVVGGGASFLAYAIVTWAFTQAPIALVTALRETSIIFALLIGVVVLKERFDRIKLVATILTLAGAILMRLASL